MLHRNLRGGGILNPGSTNKYTKFGQLIIRKFIKIIAIKCHILRLSAPNSIPGVCLSVRSSVSVLTRSTSRSDVDSRHGVTAAIAVDVVAVRRACLSFRPSVS